MWYLKILVAECGRTQMSPADGTGGIQKNILNSYCKSTCSCDNWFQVDTLKCWGFFPTQAFLHCALTQYLKKYFIYKIRGLIEINIETWLLHVLWNCKILLVKDRYPFTFSYKLLTVLVSSDNVKFTFLIIRTHSNFQLNHFFSVVGFTFFSGLDLN